MVSWNAAKMRSEAEVTKSATVSVAMVTFAVRSTYDWDFRLLLPPSSRAAVINQCATYEVQC